MFNIRLNGEFLLRTNSDSVYESFATFEDAVDAAQMYDGDDEYVAEIIDNA